MSIDDKVVRWKEATNEERVKFWGTLDFDSEHYSLLRREEESEEEELLKNDNGVEEEVKNLSPSNKRISEPEELKSDNLNSDRSELKWLSSEIEEGGENDRQEMYMKRAERPKFFEEAEKVERLFKQEDGILSYRRFLKMNKNLSIQCLTPEQLILWWENTSA
jgi:hypothetical protein